jgi:hypothetical protein
MLQQEMKLRRNMQNWMKRLVEHHHEMGTLYPNERVMIVLDIDDTILDVRHVVLYVLRSFDEAHGTEFFKALTVHDVRMSEGEIRTFIDRFAMPCRDRDRVVAWFERNLWSPTAIRGGHRPFPGAMDVIRWFQSRPNTYVGLNTGRPEAIRADTLASLTRLGRKEGVCFDHNLLYMNPYGWNCRVVESKVEGIDYFQRGGYRVVAFVDNEPANLHAVSEYDLKKEILLLHADTTFKSSREKIPPGTVSGAIFNLRDVLQAHTDRDLGRAA